MTAVARLRTRIHCAWCHSLKGPSHTMQCGPALAQTETIAETLARFTVPDAAPDAATATTGAVDPTRLSTPTPASTGLPAPTLLPVPQP